MSRTARSRPYQLDHLDEHPVVAAPRQDPKQLRGQWKVVLPSLSPRQLHHHPYSRSHHTLILIQQLVPQSGETLSQALREGFPAWQETENGALAYSW